MAIETQLGTRRARRIVNARAFARSFTALTCAFYALLAGSPALAFRTAGDLPEIDSTTPVRWDRESVPFIFAGPVPPRYAVDGVEPTISAAFSVWNEAACGGVKALYEGATGAEQRAGDGVNTISFVYEGWDDLLPKEGGATTDILYEKRDGRWRIVEADILLNAQDYTWAPGKWTGEAKDFRTVLVHELGHALGLLHPCELTAADEASSCVADSEDALSVMWPEYRLDSVAPSADDKAGICYLYECGSCSPTTNPSPCTEADGMCSCEGLGCTPDQCTAEDCALEACVAAPICEDRCTAADDGACSAFGASCSSPLECSDQACLLGAAPGGLCTRACGEGAAGCPDDWTCSRVEGSPVCVPLRLEAAGGGGCAFSTWSSSELPVGALIILQAAWLLRRRWRRESPE